MPQFPNSLDSFPDLNALSVLSPEGIKNALANLYDVVEAMQAKIGADPDGATVFRVDGAPDAEVKATLSTALTGDDNDLDYEAKLVGADGNAITVAYIDPEDVDVALGVEVDGTDIIVTLATDNGGVITSTSGDITTAIEAHEGANALVTIADKSGNDGSGVVTAMAATALEGGVDASKAGSAVPGALLVDYDSGTLYVNTGTLAEPVWTELAAPA